MGQKDIPVVILCGGMGTRLVEETEAKPKPLVDICGRPILWHIMKSYAHFGFKNFILCLGYKGHLIRDYFLNYENYTHDIRVTLGKNKVELLGRGVVEPWSITLADTGNSSMTGARVKRIEQYVDADHFMLTYGDGLCDIDVRSLLKFHLEHKKIGTVTGVHPPPRFGELIIEDDKVNRVAHFEEKGSLKGFINGGFFVFSRKFFDRLSDDDNCILEREPLTQLSSKKQLMMYRHDGFWQCMDTMRDVNLLRELWLSGKPPWKVW